MGAILAAGLGEHGASAAQMAGETGAEVWGTG